MTTSDLLAFSKLPDNLPGVYADSLGQALLQVDPGRWIEAVRIWKTGPQGRRFGVRMADLIGQMALEWAGEQLGTKRR